MALNLKLGADELRLLLESGHLLTERREFAKAKEVFEAVEAIGQGADVAQLGLANLHLVQAQPKDAEKALKAALKSNPKNALAQAQLAELHHTQGRKDEALAAIAQAESLDPKGPAGAYARAVKQAIETGIDYKYRGAGDPKGSGKKK